LISWAAKQEKFQPQGTFFLLTSTFIEQTKEGYGALAQNSAMAVLVLLDLDQALELLHSMSMEEPGANWSTTPPKLEIAQHVFQLLAEPDGESVLPYWNKRQRS
jgi:hypothetical protein